MFLSSDTSQQALDNVTSHCQIRLDLDLNPCNLVISTDDARATILNLSESGRAFRPPSCRINERYLCLRPTTTSRRRLRTKTNDRHLITDAVGSSAYCSHRLRRFAAVVAVCAPLVPEIQLRRVILIN